MSEKQSTVSLEQLLASLKQVSGRTSEQPPQSNDSSIVVEDGDKAGVTNLDPSALNGTKTTSTVQEEASDVPYEEFVLPFASVIAVKCKCGNVVREMRYPADGCNLFPIPSKFDVCLAILGSTNPCTAEVRPTSDVIAMLRKMLNVMQQAVDEDLAEEIEIDLSSAEWRDLAGTFGFVDFMVAAGFGLEGLILYFWREPEERPCPRLVLAIEFVEAEIRLIEVSNRREKTLPPLSSIGPRLTEYEAAVQALQSPRHFTTFSDLLKCVELRNFFYMCMLCSDEDSRETWIAYFVACREYCQEALAKVESFHKVLRADSNIMHAMKYSARVERHLKLIGTPPQKLSTTPSDRFSSPCFSAVSPADLLTRTPNYGNPDREMYRLAHPPLEDAWRDPSEIPAGLLNIRQCCFVNCLVQLYFRLPHFASAVMALPGGRALRRAAVECKAPFKVAHRLQSLFAYLQLSTASAINPVPLLDAVSMCADGAQFGDGSQHDPHEFASCLLEAIHEATRLTVAQQLDFSSTPPPVPDLDASQDKPERTTPVQQPFFKADELTQVSLQCTARRSVSEKETQSEKVIETSTHFIPLYFDPADPKYQSPPALPKQKTKHVDPSAALDEPEVTSLHRSLFDYFTDVQFSESGEATVATKAFTTIPQSLLFYIPSRTGVGDTKVESEFAFPLHLNLQAFVVGESQIEEDVPLEELFVKLEQAEKKHKAASTAVSMFQHLKVPAQAGLADDVAQLVAKAEKESSQAAARMKKSLDEVDAAIRKRFAFAGPSNDATLSLVGLILHVGSTSAYGHYFTYVTTPHGWVRFDDTKVTQVDVEEVFSSATRKNVYCLMYSRTPSKNSQSFEVPSDLRKVVEREDARRELKYAQRMSALE